MPAQEDIPGFTASPIAGPVTADLPDDVRMWLSEALAEGEAVHACLLADILPSGDFGERWSFLTNRRLLVLAPDADPRRAQAVIDLPLEQITEARQEKYVASSALIVAAGDRGHEIARFSLAAQHEAADLAYYINEIVKQRGEGKTFEEVQRPVTKRPGHRCSTCGRALSRWSEVCIHCVDRRQILVRLFGYLMPFKWMALLGLCLTFTITGLQLMPPYLTKVLIDDVITPGNVGLLPVVVGLLIGVNVSAAVISIFRSYIMQWVGQRVLFSLRVKLFRHLQLLRLRFYTTRQTGRIMSRVSSDLGRLQYFIAEGFQEAVVNIATMILIAAILLGLNWRLFLLALAPTPIIVISTLIFGHRMHMMYHRIWRRSAGLQAILADTIPGIRVVKAFAQEERESANFEKSSQDLFRQEMGAIKISSAFFPFLHIQTTLGSILIFGIGGYMVMNGTTTVGTLVAFTSYLWRFYGPIQQFGRMNHRLQHCVTSAERVFEILDSDPEPLLNSGKRLTPLRGEVEFKGVRFSYEPGKYALDDITFSVAPGEMIGLVGPSGAGKSTLVHLIARFFEVEEGEILIDGVDVLDLDLKWFRQQIGVVLQEPYLFHGPVWSNIAYAKPGATADEVLVAAKAANAHEFIVGLPDGYDTVIGERGQTLSGGERQRISIARAVLCNPKILILDEATASVDTETESVIQAALERLVENRTTFAIAHRLSTLRKANRLVVLERSKLIEIGSHDELVSKEDGLYARLCSLQSEMHKMKAI
ncbi:MAG: ABC transporter ATP-binding protein [Lentisphaerae bacterium]|jgi:ATP-binding cassette, subfamily B, bacterial|nr:ABC transporter ATP-binding protein [Lentisphaerota bacterium]MBT4822531.1 ABC transporter ATP-binding protein [Lentisphaerota bacterium]MBT5612585.1 ABC transporter ATP-binding protein [Lentisphaerota bacterium]MBT7055687.1 ABC transporter ATP-binding protein [Lentisphaerota bacterium]MBT7845825.1 ABC transporter ATP-binding protein [Lentisphaerota bacterium]